MSKTFGFPVIKVSSYGLLAEDLTFTTSAILADVRFLIFR